MKKSETRVSKWGESSLQPEILTAILLLIITSLTSCTDKISSRETTKPRIVVTCDPELDDNNSLIRFLLFSTDFRIEGLIYASSQFHWKGDGKGTKWFVPGREYTRFGLNMGPMESWRWDKDERFIHNAVEAYGKVYNNLKVHHADYPTPEYLMSKIKYGNIEFDGDFSKDTEGSELIKSLILDDVPGPLFITAWGGASTISRALKSIQDNYEKTSEWPAIKEKIAKKVILCLSGDQDDTYAKFIKPNFPEIEVLEPRGGNVALGFNSQANAKPEYLFYYQPEWIQENISSKGPFGELYRVWGDGKQMVKGDIFDFFAFSQYTADELRKQGYIVWLPIQPKGSWIGEGDTPTFLNLLDNGLMAHKDANYGGWAGRKKEIARPIDFTEIAEDSASMAEFMRASRVTDYPDFTPAVQNGLAARLVWSVTSDFASANHEPMIECDLNVSAKPGDQVQLKATVSDPDEDEVSVTWVQFNANSYQGKISVENPKSATTSMTVPGDAKPGQTIHMVAEAVDNGSPALTRYCRVIITVI